MRRVPLNFQSVIRLLLSKINDFRLCPFCYFTRNSYPIQGEEGNVTVGIPKAQSRRDCDNPNPNFIADLYTRVLTTFDFFAGEDGQVDFDALELLENLAFHESEAVQQNKASGGLIGLP